LSPTASRRYRVAAATNSTRQGRRALALRRRTTNGCAGAGMAVMHGARVLVLRIDAVWSFAVAPATLARGRALEGCAEGCMHVRNTVQIAPLTKRATPRRTNKDHPISAGRGRNGKPAACPRMFQRSPGSVKLRALTQLHLSAKHTSLAPRARHGQI
jgi:hypothetical protein